MLQPAPTTVCVVDDDEAVRDSLGELLESYGFRVRGFDSALAYLAHRAKRRDDDDCVLVDLHMPEMSGIEMIELLRRLQVDLPFIVITGRGDNLLDDRALRSGVTAVLHKPVDESALIDVINRATALNTLRK